MKPCFKRLLLVLLNYILHIFLICNSEGNIVIDIVNWCRGRGGSLAAGRSGRLGGVSRFIIALGGLLTRAAGCGCVLVAAFIGAAAAVTTIKHFHFVGHDVVGSALNSVFAGVFAALDAAFDIYLAAFFQILAGNFCQATEHTDIMPFGALLALPVAVFPVFAGGNRKIGHRVAAGQVAHFGVAPQVADKYHFIQHDFLLK